MKKKISISIIVLAFVTCCTLISGCSKQEVSEKETSMSIKSDYKVYEDNESLISDADTIIIGNVIKVNEPEEMVIGKAIENTEVEDIAGNDEYKPEKDVSFIYTVSEVQILKVLKGDCIVGDIIKVKQLGDVNNPQYHEGIEYYKQNSRQIFFLRTFPETNVPASALNPTQGQIDLTDNKVIKSDENNLFNGAEKEEDIVNIIENTLIN